MLRIVTLTLLFIIVPANAQRADKNDAKELYPTSLIAKLKPVADSLTTILNNSTVKQINSAWQGRARYIYAQGASALKFKKAIDAGASLYELIKIDASALSARDYLVVRFVGKKNGEPVLRFEHFSLGVEPHFELRFAGEAYQNYRDKRQGCFYQYEEGNGDDDYLEAFYFESPMLSRPLPEKYARDVQYARTLIDTQAIYQPGRDYLDYSKTAEWYSYANDKLAATGYPPSETPDWEKGNLITTADGKEIEISAAKWRELRREGMDFLMKNDADFVKIFREAIVQADSFPSISFNEFEDYVSRYDSKKKALRYKRGRRENCSLLHNYNIATLAAELGDFKTFLRAHIEIMNDGEWDCPDDKKFKEPENYLKVLNALGLQAKPMLLGSYLTIDGLPESAFQSRTFFVGPYLTYISKDKNKSADEILSMIADPDLDDFNRLLMSYIYDFYALEFTKSQRKQYAEKYKAAIATLPDYVNGDSER